MMCGSYSSRSSMVHSNRSRSAKVPNRSARCAFRSPYGMGCRTTTGFQPRWRSSEAMRRDTGLLPQPVRTAQTEMTGTLAFNWVRSCAQQPEIGARGHGPRSQVHQGWYVTSL